MYDLKGSTYNRKVKLTDEEQIQNSGLRVLKDVNYIEICEKVNIL